NEEQQCRLCPGGGLLGKVSFDFTEEQRQHLAALTGCSPQRRFWQTLGMGELAQDRFGVHRVGSRRSANHKRERYSRPSPLQPVSAACGCEAIMPMAYGRPIGKHPSPTSRAGRISDDFSEPPRSPSPSAST